MALASPRAHAADWDSVSASDDLPSGSFFDQEYRNSKPALAFGIAAEAGQVNSDVSRGLFQALHFNPGATSLLEVSVGATNPEYADVDYAKVTATAGWLQGSMAAFGTTFSNTKLSPINLKYLHTPDRGYVIAQPSIIERISVLDLRAGPMAGSGYGDGVGADPRINTSFAGIGIGAAGRLCSTSLTGDSKFRIQSGASIDLYEDLTGHLGQVGTSGRVNDDTVMGLAYFEVVMRSGRTDEWALGWKGDYDRLSPYDAAAGFAARNENTVISVYLRFSGASDIGSPAVGAEP